MKKFKDLGLKPEIMKSLDDLGFSEPTPIQEKAISFLLKSEKDLIALAQTGTGKTAAYSLPVLNNIKAKERKLQSIILSPTRELCLQISNDIKKLAKHSKDISITPVYGGERIDIQIRALKKGTNIVVGTPGRVHDLIRRNVLKLQDIKWLVLDEADEMLDMGFKDDLDVILGETPENRQTLLFSATMSKSVYSIAKNYMKDIKEISAGEKNIGADNVSHEYYVIKNNDRFEALKRILDCIPDVYGILFCRTRRDTQEVADRLKHINYNAEAMHGDISQNMRTKIMDRFRDKKIKLLVATDVAARGIDVSNLSHVINYSLPDQDETYTHRSGRTGRAKQSGISVSFVDFREVRKIGRLEDIVGKKFEHKKIPTGQDMFQQQVTAFFEEMEVLNDEELDLENEHYYFDIIKKLKKYTKDDLMNYLVKSNFKKIASDCQQAYDLNVEFRPERSRIEKANSVNLKINFGKKQGLTLKGFFALINSNSELKGLQVGDINLKPGYSLFSVEKSIAKEVMKNFKKVSFRGQKIIITTSSEEVVSFSSNRRGRSSRGRRNRKSGTFRGKGGNRSRGRRGRNR